MLAYLLVVVISYFMGTISCAYLISKYVFSTDIRQYGSKNPGTTNMLRTFGKKAGAITLIGDYLKGTLAVLISIFLAKKMGSDPDLAKYISALAVVCGHNWSIFMRFRGGKGVATSYGAMLAISPLMTLASMIFYIIILMLMTKDMSGVWVGILLSVSVVYKHRENIRKLLSGTENRFGSKAR